MANTSILIKRSGVGGLGKPTSLLAGELAYSYASNTIFIGSPTGDGVVNVGGQYYTSTLDAATSSNTASTLVKRDVNGQFSGRLDGIAGKADILTNARNFSISGGDITATTQSFDGSAAIILGASLNAVPSLGAGTYGSQTEIPIIQVAANGRVMNVTTQAISTTLSTAADTGTGSVNLLNDTLRFVGAQGITTSDSGNTVTFNVDDTVVRANAFTGGGQTINTNLTIGANNDLTVTGNLFVFGNTTTLNIDQFELGDPLLLLGVGNYFSDTFDIGFASHYNDGANAHTGLIRDVGTKEYHFFKGYTGTLDANNNINLSDPSYQEANVYASYFKGNLIATTAGVGTLTLTNALTVPNGGTGKTSFTSGEIIVGAGSGALVSLANSSFTPTGSGASNNTITSVTVDAYGRLTAATFSAISGLTVPQGGTGLSSITTNGITYGNGTGNLGVTAAAGGADQTWSNQILTVTNAGVPVWTTNLDGGSF